VAVVTTSERYRIAEVAERSGFSAPTLRYYEEIGLLPPPVRGDNGYRIYDAATLDRLRFIARAKQLGCSLEEIAELTRSWETGLCAPVQSRLQALVDAKIDDTLDRIAGLTTLTADLQRVAATLASHTPDGPCDDRCGCTSDVAADVSPPSTAVRLVVKPAAANEEVPIACTLGAGDMAGRLDDWRAALRDVVARSPLPDGVRLELGPTADVTELARLAAAEQDCCRFFGFAVVIDGRGTALEVHAPPDGQDVLTAVFGSAA